MRYVLGAVIGIWAMVSSAVAQANDAIEGVIGSQLQAFNDRDLDQAWRYASPMIKRVFQNQQAFGMMVENGYPMVWNNRDIRFLELREIAGQQWQKVMIKDAAGGLYILDYEMIETPDGWQINGVTVLPAPQVGA